MFAGGSMSTRGAWTHLWVCIDEKNEAVIGPPRFFWNDYGTVMAMYNVQNRTWLTCNVHRAE